MRQMSVTKLKKEVIEVNVYKAISSYTLATIMHQQQWDFGKILAEG